MATGRSSHTATLLRGGKIVIVGGMQPARVLSDAELYDPTTQAWTSAGSLSMPRTGHTATLLPNGKVLVAGGTVSVARPDRPASLTGAELYDPRTNSWSPAATMHVARAFHTATLLLDGKVLITGGVTTPETGASQLLASAEIYDPNSDAWAAAGVMTMPRANHSAIVLPDGRVVVIGGNKNWTSIPCACESLASAEFYDPVKHTWSPAASMHYPRSLQSATLMPDGRVLVVGGEEAAGAAAPEIFDPKTDTWSVTPAPGVLRIAHVALLLPDGKVLVAGGDHEARAQLYDWRTNSWSSAGRMAVTRAYATGTRLANGRVLVVGGFGEGSAGLGPLANTDLYDPTGMSAPATILHTGAPASTVLGIVLVLGIGILVVAAAGRKLRRRMRSRHERAQWIDPDS